MKAIAIRGLGLTVIILLLLALFGSLMNPASPLAAPGIHPIQIGSLLSSSGSSQAATDTAYIQSKLDDFISWAETSEAEEVGWHTPFEADFEQSVETKNSRIHITLTSNPNLCHIVTRVFWHGEDDSIENGVNSINKPSACTPFDFLNVLFRAIIDLTIKLTPASGFTAFTFEEVKEASLNLLETMIKNSLYLP